MQGPPLALPYGRPCLCSSILLDQVQSRGKDCSVECRANEDCTHYSWIPDTASEDNEFGICSLKSGFVVTMEDSVRSYVYGSVCGVILE